jgi:hypothetical protein
LFVLGSLAALDTPPAAGPHVTNANAPRLATALLMAEDRRVRAGDARIQMLLAQGIRRSATFASLVSALSATDVIVYIEPVRSLPPLTSGRLLLISQVHTAQRYLRIQVLSQMPASDLISTIGHELQHALEVAAASDVQDQSGLERLYRQIGQAGSAKQSYDTAAAQEAGRRIRMELAG